MLGELAQFKAPVDKGLRGIVSLFDGPTRTPRQLGWPASRSIGLVGQTLLNLMLRRVAPGLPQEVSLWATVPGHLLPRDPGCVLRSSPRQSEVKARAPRMPRISTREPGRPIQRQGTERVVGASARRNAPQ